MARLSCCPSREVATPIGRVLSGTMRSFAGVVLFLGVAVSSCSARRENGLRPKDVDGGQAVVLQGGSAFSNPPEYLVAAVATGDPAAKFAMSRAPGLMWQQRLSLIEEAAAGGHPPAVIWLARQLTYGEPSAAKLARVRALLEGLARTGVADAIVDLARCIDEQTCAPAGPGEALRWAVIGISVISSGDVLKRPSDSGRLLILKAIEQRARAALDGAEITREEQVARKFLKTLR